MRTNSLVIDTPSPPMGILISCYEIM